MELQEGMKVLWHDWLTNVDVIGEFVRSIDAYDSEVRDLETGEIYRIPSFELVFAPVGAGA